MKLTQDFGTASAWTSLANYLNKFVARILPLHISWTSTEFFWILFNSFVATVTSLSRNLNNGLFIFYSVLSSFLISLGMIVKNRETLSLTSDNHLTC